MAYPTICQPCLDGRHDECEISEHVKEPNAQRGYGGWMCVCAHGKDESEFQRKIREREEAERA